MEESTMFSTDSFMNAEVTYREARVRRGWGRPRKDRKDTSGTDAR